MVRPTTAASGLLVYFSNIVYQNPEWDLRSFNFDGDMAHTDETVGRLGNCHVDRLRGGDSPRRQDHPVSRLERSDAAAGRTARSITSRSRRRTAVSRRRRSSTGCSWFRA